MKEMLSDLGQTGLFATIGGAGFLFLVLTLLLGDHGHGHGADHSTGHGHDAHGGGGHGVQQLVVSFFSPRVLAIFLVAFGATGTVCSVYHWGPVASSATGLGTGAVFGFLAIIALGAFYRQEANSMIGNVQIIGTTGHVNTRIRSGGLGEISFVVAGQSMSRIARSHDGSEIAVGRQVRITSITGESVTVQPV